MKKQDSLRNNDVTGYELQEKYGSFVKIGPIYRNLQDLQYCYVTFNGTGKSLVCKWKDSWFHTLERQICNDAAKAALAYRLESYHNIQQNPK